MHCHALSWATFSLCVTLIAHTEPPEYAIHLTRSLRSRLGRSPRCCDWCVGHLLKFSFIHRCEESSRVG